MGSLLTCYFGPHHPKFRRNGSWGHSEEPEAVTHTPEGKLRLL